MLNRILGGEVRDKHGKYGNDGKYGIRKCSKRKRKYMGGKGEDMKGRALEEGHGAAMLNRILGGEVRRIEGRAEGKGSNNNNTALL